MRIALYIEPLTAFDHSFYTKELLVESFKEKGHEMVICLPLNEYNAVKLLNKYRVNNPKDVETIFPHIDGFLFTATELHNFKKMIENNEKYDNIIKFIESLKADRKKRKKKNKKKNKTKQPANLEEKIVNDNIELEIENNDLDNVKSDINEDDIKIIGVDPRKKPLRKGGQFLKTLEDVSGISYVQSSFPNPNLFDVLIVIDSFTKGWFYNNGNEYSDARSYIIMKFKKENKKIICVRDTPLMEYRFIDKSIKHGICSEEIFKMLGFNYKYVPNFIMPVISNLAYPKTDAMSREDFYIKYDIPLDKKLIVVLPGKISKWRNCKSDNSNRKLVAKNVSYFYEHFDEINKIAEANNYIFVSKLHTRDAPQKWLKSSGKHIGLLRADIIRYVESNDTYEMIHYSDKSISYATTMVYQTYLFDLPCMDIGSGKYYPHWSEADANLDKSPLKNFDCGKDLVYGTVASKFSKNGIKQFEQFIKTKYNINDFKYKTNNPIYGNSHGTNLNDIRDAILKILK